MLISPLQRSLIVTALFARLSLEFIWAMIVCIAGTLIAPICQLSKKDYAPIETKYSKWPLNNMWALGSQRYQLDRPVNQAESNLFK